MNNENQLSGVVEQITGKKRICEMTGKEFLQAVSKIEAELKGIRETKLRKRQTA